ncbi:hypothetical protein D9Q98_005991 [Chlorella vulgaris]|uniref:Expansin-like EG45 domain-containing protein n=1 Tax=Chlorella vulgaris TaxID=3077 RepID=A0A9D4Z0V2_CHLVU|nr:hypothetical protein D9Q98_005991 [Chlorella vulgaris]
MHSNPLLALAALLLLAHPARGQANVDGWQDATLGELGFRSTYSPAQAACGYGDIPESNWPFGGLAAIDPTFSPFAVGPQQGCGVCLEVQCTDPAQCGSAPSQTLVLLVSDYCTGCGPAAVYLAPTAFSKIVASDRGSVAGRVRRVNCNPPGPLAVQVDQYRATEGGWLRLALRDVSGGGDIQSVELAGSQRTYGAVWEVSGVPDAPLDLRASDGSGQQVVARRALTQAGQTGTFPTSAQFQATQNLADALGAGPRPPAATGSATGATPVVVPPPSPTPAAGTTFGSIFRGSSPAAAPSAEAQSAVPPAAPVMPPPPPAAEPALPPAPQPAGAVAVPAPGGGAAAAAAPAPEPAVAPPTSAIQVVPSQQAGQAPPSTGAAAAQPVLPPTLPLPAASAPAVEDNRPSRPPGVGPSVTPAPVSFTPVPGLPTLPPQPPLAGPVPPAQLASAASLDPATCQTLGEVLAAIPEASNWTQLLKRVGLNMLLQDPEAQVTLLVPVNSGQSTQHSAQNPALAPAPAVLAAAPCPLCSLGAAIDARPLRSESTLAELVQTATDIINPLVGYQVLTGLWPTAALQPGTKVNTADTIDKVNRLQVTALGPTSLQGIGSSANILQADIVACGPSLVLLPFTFDQAALDAITATQVPQPAQPALAPQPAGR